MFFANTTAICHLYNRVQLSLVFDYTNPHPGYPVNDLIMDPDLNAGWNIYESPAIN